MRPNPEQIEMSQRETHLKFLKQALLEARKSPPKPTNFRVGCVLVSHQNPETPQVLSAGYTLELPGNTHAEQCALQKLAEHHGVETSDLPQLLPSELNLTLYTTLEPCGKRLSGNQPCVQRIIATRHNNGNGGVRRVVFGAKEPGTFVQDSQSCRLLTEAGIEWEYIADLEQEILEVAMEGHESQADANEKTKGSVDPVSTSQMPQQEPGRKTVEQYTSIDDISPEERKRQEEQPKNPKKRMMEI